MMKNEQNLKELSMEATIYDELMSTGFPGCDYLSNPKVNLKSGRLLYGVEDISVAMNSYEIAATHIYSSNMCAGVKTLFSKYGNGWKINFDQYIISNAANNQYKYVDQLGYVHDFAKIENNRYYDITNANIVLEVTNSGYDLKDDNNNLIHFNADGRIAYTQSGMNSNIKKQFTYLGENLYRVYDVRKTADYLEFTYKDGKLDKIIKCRSGNEIESIIYHYDANQNIILTEVKVGNAVKTRNVYFYDENNLLTLVTNPETKEAIQITYDGNQAKKIANGKVSGGSAVVEGKTYENNFQAITYTELLTLGDNQRQIKNELNIYSLVQWDTDGNIVSSFEQDSGNIKTWERESGEMVTFSNPSTSERINSRAVAATSSVNTAIGRVNFSNFSGSNKCFLCSLYLKITDNGNSSILKLKLKINGKDFTVTVNGKAQNVWQKVIVPLQFDSVPTGSLTVYAGVVTFENFSKPAVIAEMLIKPSAIQANYINNQSIKDLLQINSNSNVDLYFKLADNSTHKVNFTVMTESDILNAVMYPIAKTGGGYELICGGGKGRLANVTSLYLSTNSSVNLLSGNAQIQTKSFVATGDEAAVTTYSRVTVDGKLCFKTEQGDTYSIVDEFGRILEKNDVYGLKLNSTDSVKTVTKYEYSQNGDLKEVTLVGHDGTEMLLAEYGEDASGTQYISTEKSGNSGCEYKYNSHDILESAQNILYNGSTKMDGGKVTYGYNDFADNLRSVNFTYNGAMYGGNAFASTANRVLMNNGISVYYLTENSVGGEIEFGYNTGNDPILKQRRSGISATSEYYRTGYSIDRLYYGYDKYGKLINIYENDEEEPKTTFEYDACNESKVNRLLTSVVDDFSSDTTKYEYDKNHNLKKWSKNGIEVITEEDETKTYVFKAGVMSDKTPESFSSKSDIIGTINYLNGSKVQDVSCEYFYDNFGRLGYIRSDARLMYYRYDGLHLRGYTYTNTATTGASGAYSRIENYEYDGYGNITGVELKEDNVTTGTRKYEYDAFGRLTRETNTLMGITRNYTYSQCRMAAFGGNSCTYNSKGQLTKFGSNTSYTYDNCGNRLTRVTGANVERYGWTRGRLLSRYTNAAGTAYDYFYDWQGIRSRKNNTLYYYDGNKLLGEYVNTIGGAKTWYYYDKTGICGMRSNGTNYAFVKNPFGDVIAIVQGGKIVAKYEYDAWGNHKVFNPNGTVNTNTSFIGNINPIRYRGYYYDVESGLYYLQTRYYDPTIGQFISLDSPEYLAPTDIGGLNLYAYCSFNPVMIKQKNEILVGSGNNFSFTEKNVREVNWTNTSAQIPIWVSSLMTGSDYGASIIPAIRTLYYYVRYPWTRDLNHLYGLDYVPGTANTICSVIGYCILALDIGLAALSNFTNTDLTPEQQWISFGVDTAYILLNFGVGYGVGALVSLIPGVGVFIAPFAAAAVTWFIDWTNSKWRWTDAIKQWLNSL